MVTYSGGQDGKTKQNNNKKKKSSENTQGYGDAQFEDSFKEH